MDKFRISKSYRDGHIGLRFSVKREYTKIDGGSDLTTTAARELAKALTDEADRVDARMSAREAKEQRRQKWRDREVAAGRLKIMSLGDLVQRR